jgi:riboflavin synthase
MEAALKIGDELGGHIVTGHIDGIAEISMIEMSQNSKKICITPPSNLLEFIAVKGSVCLDGISLTVNQVDNQTFWVNIIPYTQQATTWHNLTVGDKINIEIDMMARYACRYFSYHSVIDS